MLLSVEDLKVSYGNIKALHGLDFQIDEAEDAYERGKPLYKEKIISEQEFLSLKR